MTLTTHAVVGAAIARAMAAHPALGLPLAFMSHFALDALPHWDYPLRSISEDPSDALNTDMKFGRDFLIDLVKIGSDFLLGLGLGYLIGGWLGLAGGLAAQLPDALQFIHFKLRLWPVALVQRFHIWIHTKRKLKGRSVVGVLSQLALILAVCLFVYYY